MADEDIKRELSALRAEMAAISRRLEPLSGASSDAPPAGAGTRGPSVAPPAKTTSEAEASRVGARLREALAGELGEHTDVRELSRHVAQFLESLGRDVKDSRPRALVAAFVAGVAAGRMMGR